MTHFDKLLTACVTCVELDGCETRELCAQMRTGGLANARWARYHDTTEVVHAIFAGLLEVSFHTTRPITGNQLKAQCVIRWRNIPIVEPLLELLNLPLVTTDLFQSLWSIAISP